MTVSAIRKCGTPASRRCISHDWLDTDRKLATHAISLLVLIRCRCVVEERCLCLFSRASAAMAHRDHGHDHYAPAPQACRQPCCSKSSLMALCGQDEGGPWWSASGWYAASRRHGFVDSLDGEEATSHTRGEASSLSGVRTRSARALPILGMRGLHHSCHRTSNLEGTIDLYIKTHVQLAKVTTTATAPARLHHHHSRQQ